MACTKETYTATATWTASQLANLFRDAFIDAGLMTAWFDSFANGGIENRILEVTYDGTKAYGKTYYWFMFSTSGVFLHVATGWNPATDQPTGTQYLDFFSTTTNATTNHSQIFSASTANTVELVRYTSGADTDQSWFIIKSGTTRRCFTIVNDAMTVQPWMDLAKGFFAGFGWIYPRTGGASTPRRYGTLAFMRGPALRRDLVLGTSLNQATDPNFYSGQLTTSGGPSNKTILAYGAVGNAPNTNSPNNQLNGEAFEADAVNSAAAIGGHPGAIILPNNFSGTNPAFTSNSNPIFHSLTWNPYITESLPADFGLTFHYATNSFSQGDTFVVSAGTEEWEVLDFAANASAVTGASPLFLARMV
jgi:hypothetical protein